LYIINKTQYKYSLFRNHKSSKTCYGRDMFCYLQPKMSNLLALVHNQVTCFQLSYVYLKKKKKLFNIFHFGHNLFYTENIFNVLNVACM
jgi:hypothetical protein